MILGWFKVFFYKLPYNFDLSYPTKALQVAHKILKKTGAVLVLEMAVSDVFCPTESAEFTPVAVSVMHCLPCSRPPSGPPGEDIGNPFRMDQLTQIAKNAGFSEVHHLNDYLHFETFIS